MTILSWSKAWDSPFWALAARHGNVAKANEGTSAKAMARTVLANAIHPITIHRPLELVWP